MILFVLMFSGVQLCAWVFGTYADEQRSAFMTSGASPRDFLLPMVLLPTVAAWLTAETVSAFRTPRLFAPAPRSATAGTWLVRLVVGGVVGVLHVAVAGVLLRFNQEYFADVWVMSVAGCVSVLLVSAFLPRRAGTGCSECGYDWKGLARCPECGTLRAAQVEPAAAGSVHPVTAAQQG